MINKSLSALGSLIMKLVAECNGTLVSKDLLNKVFWIESGNRGRNLYYMFNFATCLLFLSYLANG